MAARNPDSMTNAQGEFHPAKPRAEPLTSKGHQLGQQVGNDAVPEFHAQTLPPGSAPSSKTFQPNPINETPGQALNPDANRSHGKEETTTSALDSLPGATSADVHAGLGKPESNQTSAELSHDGKSHRARESAGLEGSGATGGLGLRDEPDAEARRLQSEHNSHGPKNAQEHNATLAGAESKQ